MHINLTVCECVQLISMCGVSEKLDTAYINT